MKEYNSEPGLFGKVDKSGLWALPIIIGVVMILFYIFIWLFPSSDEPMQDDTARSLSSIIMQIFCNLIYIVITIISFYIGMKWKKQSAT